jgi:predicted Zn-dependent protease
MAANPNRAVEFHPLLLAQRCGLRLIFTVLFGSFACAGFTAEVRTSDETGELKRKEGNVRYQAAGSTEVVATIPQLLNYGDRLRTLLHAKATVQFASLGETTLGHSTDLLIVRGTPTNAAGARIIKGNVYVIHRAGPDSTLIETPLTVAVPKGTEFSVSVDPETGESIFTMFDGEVILRRAGEERLVARGFQGIVAAGKPIEVRPILQAENLIQWWIHYPGVIDVLDLDPEVGAGVAFAESIRAYRTGNLRRALEAFPGHPDTPVMATTSAQVYYSALLLSVGDVKRADELLRKVRAGGPAARAMRTMVDAVAPSLATNSWRALNPPVRPGERASELLALSYAHQATNNLASALHVARQAVEKSPTFGFGWARVAELEFSHGHTKAAHEAVTKALEASPQHAQAHALRGFLFAAGGRHREALNSFDQAVALDSFLANGWLGRGLVRIRLGDSEGGREDLRMASAAEPSRSLLRSYTGKAFADAGQGRLAIKELAVAKEFDSQDPTPFLYSALLLREQNQINASIGELERSIELNDNRALYRSRFLLDEDRAVRSSSLATLFQSAGLDGPALREAARAVSLDYANYSAHQFLSESYDALRDPTRFNLRYETVWFNELLLANLLSPVGGTPLSQHISQQEYSRLFTRDRIGLSTDSSYRSDGQYREQASQFGVLGSTAWSLDLDYQHNNGVRPNNELDRLEWYTTIKQQLSANDSILLLTKYQNYHSGDNFQYYDPQSARPDFSYEEPQHAIIMAGYHHEWSPGIHTLALGGRLVNEQRFGDQNVIESIVIRTNGMVSGLGPPVGFDVNYESQLEIYTGEINQIFDTEHQTLILGGRYQAGPLDTRSVLTDPVGLPSAVFQAPPADTTSKEQFRRASAYAYETLKLPGQLRLTGGLAFDQLTFPEHFRSPPVSEGSETRTLWGPKGALVWQPLPAATLRAAYTRSLGGVSLDESYRLEPAQLAGFAQAFRSVIPESSVGSVTAPEQEAWGGAIDLKFRTHTYVGLQGECLNSRVRDSAGVFDYILDPFTLPILPSSTPRQLDYTEHTLAATLHQLFGENWAVGAGYRFSRAELDSVYPQLATAVPSARRSDRADLHELRLSALFQHPSGFFATAEVNGYWQDNQADSANLPDDSFAQVNLLVGYRFPRQRGEITVGGLNLNGSDYRLNPLNLHPEFPRERVFVASLLVNF